MKYFFDTEFVETRGHIELISIGIICEDQREYYAVHTEADLKDADDWVKEHVLKPMPEYSGTSYNDLRSNRGNYKKKTLDDIKKELIFWTGQLNNVPEKCEFYAYFGAYDWVVFQWIFGKMINKPEGFPMWVIDLKQMMWERGLSTTWKREVHPDPVGEHNALVDAKWNQELYLKILHVQTNV